MSTETGRTHRDRLQQQFEDASRWYAEQHAGKALGCVLIHAGLQHQERLSDAHLRNVIFNTEFINGGISRQLGEPGWRLCYVGEQDGVTRFVHLARRAASFLRDAPPGSRKGFSALVARQTLADLQWVRCVFELAWKTSAHAPLHAKRQIWDGSLRLPWDVAQLKRFAAMGMPADYLPEWIRELPDYYCSDLPDIFLASADALTMLSEEQANDGKPAQFEFKRGEGGQAWTVTFEGVSRPVRDLKGMGYLAILLSHPNRQLSAIDLELIAGTDVRLLAGQLHEGVVDLSTLADIRTSLREAESARNTAVRDHDLAESERLTGEIGKIREYLGQVTGLNDTVRLDSDLAKHAHRIREAITRSIKEIGKSHRSLGRHLQTGVNFKGGFEYRANPAPDWQV